jgi:hypothetical protein
LYDAKGTYDPGNGEIRVVNEKLSINYTESGDVIFIYSMTELPYSISSDFMILSDTEISSMKKNNITVMYGGAEPNPFRAWYGITTYKGTIDTDDYSADFTWDANSGVAMHVEIEKKHEMQEVFQLNYLSSTFDIYAPYPSEYTDTAMFVMFIVSPPGLVLLSLPFITFVILISFVVKVRQKLKIKRGARIPAKS